MIQRIQSVFMAIGAIAMFAIMFTPIWWKQSLTDGSNELVLLDALKMLHTQEGNEVASTPTFFIAILAFASSALFVGSILSYKSRIKQVQFNLINTLLMVGILGINTYFIFFQGINIFEPMNQGAFGVGYYLPIVALFMNLLANRFIRKDEKLVRSVDRLR